MKNSSLYYSVGPLLYCPANQKNIVESIITERFGTGFSLALCLEDTINDDYVTEAEQDLVKSVHAIYDAKQKQLFYLPKLFIRVRNAEQMPRLITALGNCAEIITGFIFPKFSEENAKKYVDELLSANAQSVKNFYMMPIYESNSIIDLRYRKEILYNLRDILAPAEEYVLNIRVGGNDLCHAFGFRRHDNESIHRIRPVANIFADIITAYGEQYVVSGPVWEYYSGDNWKQGLQQEIADDILCGFIGKTVIHPEQIRVINECYRVSREDFNDAQAILNWNRDSINLVSGNSSGQRMNEYKTHSNWAQKTVYLAEAFGIRE